MCYPVYFLREANLCGAEASETIVDNLQKHDKWLYRMDTNSVSYFVGLVDLGGNRKFHLACCDRRKLFPSIIMAYAFN